MNKKSAFQKCIPIVGGFFDKKERYIQRYKEDLKHASSSYEVKRATQKLELWKKKEPQISITLESIDEIRN